MPLFMFASGYVYMMTKKDDELYQSFIVKKIKRLMIPYFTTSVLVITLKYLTQQSLVVDNPVTLRTYFEMLYLPSAGYFLWFIWALFLMFIVTPFFKTKNQRIILFVISCILHYIPFEITDIFCINQFKTMLIYFVIGILMYDYKQKLSFVKNIPLVIGLILFTVLFVSKNCDVKLPSVIYTIIPLSGIFIICKTSMFVSTNAKKLTKISLYISGSSYIIYLFHTTFMGFAKAILPKLPFLHDTNNNIVFLSIAVIVSITGVILPIILQYEILTKNKYLCLLFGLKYKQKSIIKE